MSEHDPAIGHGSTSAPWQWTATAIAAAVRSREISAREVIESCIARIAEVNPKINALKGFEPDEALAMADDADEAVRAGAPLGPLHGVPVSVTINADQAGHATSDGVVAFKDNIATQDAPQVAALRNAGAVFLGRSNAPDFSYRWFTDNDLFGRTVNPWDPAVPQAAPAEGPRPPSRPA